MAYAAVISLKHTLKYLEDFPISRSAKKKLVSLLDTLIRLDSSRRISIDATDAQIREAVAELENFLRWYASLRTNETARSAKEDLESLGYNPRSLDSSSNRSINRSAINAQNREALCKLDDVLLWDASLGTNATAISLQEDLESLCYTLRRLEGFSYRFKRRAIDPLNAQVREAVRIKRRAIDPLNAQVREAVCKLKDVLLLYGSLPIKANARSPEEVLESLFYTLRRLDGSSNRGINRSAINALDAQIGEAVCKLEDALLPYLLWPRGGLEIFRANEEGEELVREMYSFSKTVWNLKVEYSRELDNPLPLQEEDDDVSPTDDFDGNKSTMVGLWDQFEKIRNELLDSQPEPKVVSLVGMAGIGKTHLVTQIYHDPFIGERFDFRVWLSVGPQQQVKNLWAYIVALVEGVPRNAYTKTNIITLVGHLQKSLLGRGRCLIVLDDVWSTMVCDSLIRLLRTDGNGRRILLTTRLEEVAKYFSTSIYQIRFMDKEESWKLLWQNVFGEEYFPRELEKAGRKIAENCEGLPLLILAIAEILCGLEKTEEYWNKVADSKTTTFTDAYERISEVLFSSYEYLPQYLKACFLYMGVFPQKSEIPLPKLLNLWIVEDFLEPHPSLIRTKKTDATFQNTSNVDKTIVSRILEERSASGAARGSKMKPPFINMQSKPGVLMISENVDLLEPNRLETSRARIFEDDALSRAERFLPRDARALDNVNWNSKGNYFKICRYEAKKPLESLYLLEPGPSPIRFIEPWKKNKLWDSKLCLNRDLWSPTRKQPLPKAVDISVPKVKTTPKGIAMQYLKKLVSHSLAIVCKRSSTNKIKSCKLHSAYWYLCVKEARKNKFFHVLKKLTDASTDYIERQRRLSVQNNMLFGIKEVYDSIAASSTTRSLVCTGPDQEYPVPICMNLRLLKVLDALAIRLYDFPTEVAKLLELRYLALTHNGRLPSSIRKLEQLEYLIVCQHHNIKLLRDSTSWPEVWRTKFLRDSTSLPKEIWDMKALVYLRIIGRNLPDPSHGSKLPKLSTLHVNAHS